MGTITLTHIRIIDRIVNKSIERIFAHMPQFHNPPTNWDSRGTIKIIPKPFWRRCKLLNWVVPYRVGDRINFDIEFEKPNITNGMNSHVVFEFFAGKLNNSFPINDEKSSIRGNIINAEGDVEYSIGFALYKDQSSHTIFTARAENWDTILSRWSWAIVGAIFSLLCGVLLWLLGIIQINPEWQISIIH